MARAGARVSARGGRRAPPAWSRPIYQQGNILIDAGKLRIGSESLPLVNILAASRQRVGQPKRHWTTIMIAAAACALAGIRFSGERWGLALIAAGASLGAWAWFFHRRKAWIVRLHLLLNQRIQVLFDGADDADQFLAALAAAKGGDLPVMRSG